MCNLILYFTEQSGEIQVLLITVPLVTSTTGFNIKTICFFSLRLGSKLPAGVSQPPQFAKKPWETQPKTDPWSQDQNRPIGRPLGHTPYIRNPKLRQYYLQGEPAEFHHPHIWRGLLSSSGSLRNFSLNAYWFFTHWGFLHTCVEVLAGGGRNTVCSSYLEPRNWSQHNTTHQLCLLHFSGTSWDVNNTATKHQDMEGASYDRTDIMVSLLFS